MLITPCTCVHVCTCAQTHGIFDKLSQLLAVRASRKEGFQFQHMRTLAKMYFQLRRSSGQNLTVLSKLHWPFVWSGGETGPVRAERCSGGQQGRLYSQAAVSCPSRDKRRAPRAAWCPTRIPSTATQQAPAHLQERNDTEQKETEGGPHCLLF